jgi:hypothetical protein
MLEKAIQEIRSISQEAYHCVYLGLRNASDETEEGWFFHSRSHHQCLEYINDNLDLCSMEIIKTNHSVNVSPFGRVTTVWFGKTYPGKKLLNLVRTYGLLPEELFDPCVPDEALLPRVLYSAADVLNGGNIRSNRQLGLDGAVVRSTSVIPELDGGLIPRKDGCLEWVFELTIFDFATAVTEAIKRKHGIAVVAQSLGSPDTGQLLVKAKVPASAKNGTDSADPEERRSAGAVGRRNEGVSSGPSSGSEEASASVAGVDSVKAAQTDAGEASKLAADATGDSGAEQTLAPSQELLSIPVPRLPDGLYEDENAFIWGGYRFGGLVPRMMRFLKVLWEERQKNVQYVAKENLRKRAEVGVVGGVTSQVFKLNRKDSPGSHPVRKIVGKFGADNYCLIDPKKVPEVFPGIVPEEVPEKTSDGS